MDKNLLLFLLNALTALTVLQESGLAAELEADIAALRAKLREKVAPKADGTPYTDADVRAAAADVRLILDELDRRHAAPQGDGDPRPL